MRIAIVGGIGSGKSEVLKVARDMGLACLSADEINAELLKTPEYIAEIATAFPAAVKDGGIDKAALAKIVFSDDSAR
ncbi:MAG: dephospho-CoA kinase, partial [Clostridiales bacterium]|nr:dephospho-CoA kinase [Clostridiales bacterium]